VGVPQEEDLKRLRLSYSDQTQLDSFSYTYAVDTTAGIASGSTNGNVTITDTINEQTFQWRSSRKDSSFTYEADSDGKMTGASLQDLNGYTLNIGTDGKLSVSDTGVQEPNVRTTTLNGNTITVTTFQDSTGNTVFTSTVTEDSSGNITESYVVDSQGNKITLTYNGSNDLTSITDPQGNTINTNNTGSQPIEVINADGDTVMTATASLNAATGAKSYSVYTSDKDLTTDLKVEKMTQTEFEDYLTKLAADPDTVSEEYKDTLIYLPDSGELVLGSNLANNMTSEAATLNVTYNKEGFAVGETRPEMYFNCTNQSDASRANWITYTNYDADHNWISQNINYTVSGNQEMAINTQIHDVVDADCYRDLAEMTDIVQASIDAHTTVTNIENMLASSEYADEASQNYLNDCLEKANKQMAYMDDHLQKVFGTQITNFENYQSKINLAITNVGTKGDQLSLAENRISNQQTTFKDLKSSNEDEELSDVTIDYTSAYTAFQASLQAAGKIDDMSLLDYL
jgi:YD repeat-containing protein